MCHQKFTPILLAYSVEMEDQFMVYSEYSWTLKNGKTIRVPEGFMTDLASIPRAFRWLVKGHNRYSIAAVVHDYLCVHGKDLNISRKRADAIFLEIMKGCDVPRWKAFLMYKAVRSYAVLSGKY